jgi:hypothetical protein
MAACGWLQQQQAATRVGCCSRAARPPGLGPGSQGVLRTGGAQLHPAPAPGPLPPAPHLLQQPAAHAVRDALWRVALRPDRLRDGRQRGHADAVALYDACAADDLVAARVEVGAKHLLRSAQALRPGWGRRLGRGGGAERVAGGGARGCRSTAGCRAWLRLPGARRRRDRGQGWHSSAASQSASQAGSQAARQPGTQPGSQAARHAARQAASQPRGAPPGGSRPP